jgi:hypothetical protein
MRREVMFCGVAGRAVKKSVCGSCRSYLLQSEDFAKVRGTCPVYQDKLRLASEAKEARAMAGPKVSAFALSPDIDPEIAY